MKQTQVTKPADNTAIKGEIVVTVPEAPVLLDSLVTSFCKDASPAESSLIAETTKAVVSSIASAQQNLLDVGEKMTQLRAKLGGPRFWQYVSDVLAKGRIASRSSIALWMSHARILREAIPNETVRRAILTVGGGRQLIVKQDLTEAEAKAEGISSKFDLSPFVREAMSKVHPPKGKLNDEAAERYVRQVLDVAGQYRSKARVNGSKVENLAQHKAQSLKRFSGFLSRYGTAQAGKLLAGMFAAYIKAATLEETENLVGTFDKLLEAAQESGINGTDAAPKAKAQPKAQPKAAPAPAA